MEQGSASPLTSVTVFHFTGAARLWAFLMMARAPSLLRGVPGLRFARMMGSGRGAGFTLRPDWNRYAMLGAWESREAFESFGRESQFMRHYTARSARSATLLLRTRTAHGAWDGVNPFLPSHSGSGTDERVVVFTRATIRLRSLRAFWRWVPPVRQRLNEARGLAFSIGIGERPLTRQATLSLWRTEEEMKAFAYGSDEAHREVVRRTREDGWYREELFARFDLVEMLGNFP